MLRALYEYANTHPEVRQREGCEIRTVKFIVDIVSPDIVAGVRAIDKTCQKVNCPSAGKITVNIEAHPLIEKAEISLRIEPAKALSDRQMASLEAKRDIFYNRFADNAVHISAFGPVAAVLGDPQALENIVGIFQSLGGTSADTVGFSVDGVDLWDMPDILDWWSWKVSASEDDAGFIMLDVVTGEPCEPVKLWKAMRGRCTAGGQSSGVSLVSFNSAAFDTYGLVLKDQNLNCPVSRRTADMIMDAAIYLGNRSRNTVGDARLVHWYAGNVPNKDDLLDMLFGSSQSEDDDDGQADANADRLVNSPFSGDVPPDLSNIEYHIMVMQPFAARMAVRSYECGCYGDLYSNIKSWFDDLSVQTAYGVKSRFLPKFYGLLFALLTDAESKSRTGKLSPISPHVPGILNACFHGKAIPDAIGYRAISGFRSGMYPRDGSEIQWGRQHKRVMWIRIWNNRKDNMYNMGDVKNIPEMLDRNLSDGPYVCGRLMAVYDELQRRASPGMNATVVSRYFTSCAQNPALVLGRLQSMSVHHMENIRSRRLKDLFGDEFANAWGRLGTDIPRAMSMAEQARFACGYWQEHGYLKEQCSTLFAATGKSAASGDENKEENQNV